MVGRVTGSVQNSILLVGEDSIPRETLAEILRLEGYLVETAEASAEALEAARPIDPAVLLVDLASPATKNRRFVTGFDGWRGRVPIVAMTDDRDQRRSANKIGAASCIAKPIKLGDLLPTIERLCSTGAAVRA